MIDATRGPNDADSEIEVQQLSSLRTDEAIELGSKVGALIGPGIDGEQGAELGAAVKSGRITAQNGF